MRPVKLVISAFGPYAEEEVIDFSLLNGKNIFLITGATGAGKTTIFDAISYALFGEASGSTRENESLRSDFAAVDRLTFVELDFELKGEKYHIKRIPQQMKPKVKGEGFTHQGSEAELILPDGKVRTGTGNVTNKINELLGINKEQFKQIVMLPQGEFKKLLLADSKEREVIFRKIFGTYSYEKIQILLSDKAKKLYKDLEKSRDRILVNLKNIKSDAPIIENENIDFNSVVDKIEENLKLKKNESKEIEKELSEVRKSIEKLQEGKIQGINNNNLINENEKVESMLEDYKKKAVLINEKEKELIKINKAKEILYVEDELLKQKKNKEIKEKGNLEIAKNIERIKANLEKAEFELENQEAKENEKNKLIESINSLNEKKPKIIEYDRKKDSVSSLKIKIKDIKESSIKEQETLEKLKNEESKNEDNIKNITEFEKQKILLEKETSEKEKLIEDVRSIYKAIKKLEEYKKVYNKLKAEFTNKESAYKESKIVFEEKQEIYMKEQAGILAGKLVDGKACPVCGAVEHPNPAIRMVNVPTEEEIKKSQELYEGKQKEYNEILINMAKVKSSIDSLISDVLNKKLNELGEYIEDTIYNDKIEEKILALGKKLGYEIKELNLKLDSLNNEISKKDTIIKQIDVVKEKIKSTEKRITELNEMYTNEFALLKANEEKFKSLEEEIPKNIRSIKQLEDKILEIKEKIDLFNKIIKQARDKVNQLNNDLSSQNAKLEEGRKILSELNDDINNKEDIVDKRILESNFENYDEYDKVKKYINKIDEIQSEIIDFKEKFKSLCDRSSELKLKTKELEYVNIEDINEEIEKKKKEEGEINDRSKEIYSIITNNDNILKKIKEINITLREKEDKYKIIGELSNLANGKKSPYISFERFVLASYFQEIIDAANLRLSKMTAGRFILKRKEDKGKGTAQQGLELEVYDNYTGKCRHVKTLSGGESFKASLSLALGLSDVVQANAGGIALDTIFIDEGFGTLDPESLDNAINSLIELQKGGRLVGIISHVPELKERIEAKLEVKATLYGSSTKFNFD